MVGVRRLEKDAMGKGRALFVVLAVRLQSHSATWFSLIKEGVW